MKGFAEIVFRLRQEAANVFLWAFPPSLPGTDISVPLPGLPEPRGVAGVVAGTPFAAELVVEAERVLAGQVAILGTVIKTGPEPAWRRDYLSGLETEAVFFRRIPYLDPLRAGDHKNIWELSRHQHLVLVAQAYVVTGDERYRDFVVAQLRHWFRENPFQCGINWASSLEVGFRALSWLWILHLLGEKMVPAFRDELVTGIYRHGFHLEYNLSIYFSPNTHLLGEALALHAIGCLLPSLERSGRWRTLARRILLEQLEVQVYTDGGYFEQSTYYHLYALDMFLFHHTLEGLPNPERLRGMAEFLAALLSADGDLPFLGDDDGGRLFFPFGPRKGFGRATLATVGAVFGQSVFGQNYGQVRPRDLQEQAVWWLGPKVMEARPLGCPPCESRAFRDFGIASMQADDIRILFDVGPFGPWGSGHSHSDTLSLVAGAGEMEILIDPGTFTYVGDAGARNWFRGSAAHNTIRIDGRDQATPAGPFRWLDKPAVEWVVWETSSKCDVAEGTCTAGGIRHRRRVVFHKAERRLTVTDCIEWAGEVVGGEVLIEQFWHPGQKVSAAGEFGWQIGEGSLLILDPRLAGELTEGWRSDAHASRRTAPVIRAWSRVTIPVVFQTTLRLGTSREFVMPKAGST